MNEEMGVSIDRMFDVLAGWIHEILVVDQFVYYRSWNTLNGRTLEEINLYTRTGHFVSPQIWFAHAKDFHVATEDRIPNSWDDCYDVDGNAVEISRVGIWSNKTLCKPHFIGKLHWLLMKQLCLHGFSIGSICQLNHNAIYHLYIDQLPWKK